MVKAYISIFCRLDSIAEKNVLKLKRCVLFLMGIASVLLLITAIISLFSRGAAMVTDGSATSTLIDTILNFATLIFTGYTCTQIAVSRDINRVEISNYICDCDKEYRKQTADAKKQLITLADKLVDFQPPPGQHAPSSPDALPSAASATDSDGFQTIYTSEPYETLRAFAYHYEYIGFLVLRNRVDFDVVFDTISFPNWLIHSLEAKQIITAGRHQTPDFWCGVNYLYCSYEVKRKYNAMQTLQGLPKDAQKRKAELKRRKAAYKAACTAWIDNYKRTLI